MSEAEFRRFVDDAIEGRRGHHGRLPSAAPESSGDGAWLERSLYGRSHLTDVRAEALPFLSMDTESVAPLVRAARHAPDPSMTLASSPGRASELRSAAHSSLGADPSTVDHDEGPRLSQVGALWSTKRVLASTATSLSDSTSGFDPLVREDLTGDEVAGAGFRGRRSHRRDHSAVEESLDGGSRFVHGARPGGLVSLSSERREAVTREERPRSPSPEGDEVDLRASVWVVRSRDGPRGGDERRASSPVAPPSAREVARAKEELAFQHALMPEPSSSPARVGRGERSATEAARRGARPLATAEVSLTARSLQGVSELLDADSSEALASARATGLLRVAEEEEEDVEDRRDAGPKAAAGDRSSTGSVTHPPVPSSAEVAPVEEVAERPLPPAAATGSSAGPRVTQLRAKNERRLALLAGLTEPRELPSASLVDDVLRRFLDEERRARGAEAPSVARPEEAGMATQSRFLVRFPLE